MTLFYTLIIVMAAALLLAVCAGAVCIKLLFFSKNQSYADSLAILQDKRTSFCDAIAPNEIERVQITATDGMPLTGYYVNRFPEARKVAVLVHGIRANHVIGLQYGPLFLPHGYNLLSIDQRAHGQSGGRFPTYGQQEPYDLAAWLAYLRTRLGPDCEIGLMGHSMGAATALCCPAVDAGVRFIVADCPFDTLSVFLLHQLRRLGLLAAPLYRWLRLMIRLLLRFDPERVSPLQAVCNEGRDIPVLFFHSEGDRIIPCVCAQRMYEARSNRHDRLCLSKTAAHPDIYAQDTARYRAVVDDFLSQLPPFSP